MRNFIYKILQSHRHFLLLLPFLWACNDIIEEDISQRRVDVLSPPANYISSTSTIEFNWNEMEGASNYNLQVVSPDYANLLQIKLDTNVSSTTFTAAFTPGMYELRIIAENGAYQSLDSYRKFSVDSVSGVSGEQVLLIEPGNNFVTVEEEISFSWQPVFNADNYTFEIRHENQEGNLVYPSEIINSTSKDLLLEEGKYYWGVQAHNESSNSTAFSYRNVIIDQTEPGPASLLFPGNTSTIPPDTIFTFAWNSGLDELSNVSDSLFLYAAGNSDNAIFAESDFSPILINTDTIVEGNYSWRIKSTDQAGNFSLSDLNEFTID